MVRESRKTAAFSILALAVAGALVFADWRQWLPWPKLLHYSYTNSTSSRFTEKRFGAFYTALPARFPVLSLPF